MRYSKFSRSLFYALLDVLGEEAVVVIAKKAMERPDFQFAKYGEITEGQLEALLNIIFQEIGKERLPDILARRLKLTWKEVSRLLVDKNSRCIPEGLSHSVIDPNRDFHLAQPLLNRLGIIVRRLARLKEFWPFPVAVFPSDDEVEARYQAILNWLNLPENEENGIKNLLNGPYFLGVLPQIPADDYGTILEELVEAAGQSYQSQFPDRQFFNHQKGKLAGQVGIECVRYPELIKAATQGPVVWVSFRTCLQGFSIPADREQEARMPDKFILSGGWDTAADIIAYPDVLLRDSQTIGLDCAANSWHSAGYSLSFKAHDDYAVFGSRDLGAYGSYSSGVVLLG